MTFEKIENWGEFRHDGILYFAHRVSEMLNHYSPGIFKAPVLSPHLLAVEYLRTFHLVEEKTIDDHHLKYILEEFINSFNSNSIINENIDPQTKERIVNSLGDVNIEHQKKIMSYACQRLGNYGKWCIDYAKKVILEDNGKNKTKIEKAIRSLIPELVGSGYSHEYIYIYCKKCFFESPVTSVECLNIFLDRFDFRNKEYTIYIASKRQLKSLSGFLKARLGIQNVTKAESDKNCSDYIFDRKTYFTIKQTINAFDEQSAAHQVYHGVYLFLDFFDYISDNENDWMLNTAKVFDENGNFSFVKLASNGFHVQTEINEHTKYLSDVLIGNLIKNTKHFDTIYRCIKLHNNAISEDDLRNGFLNLWSITEILFANDSDSKIKTISNAALPLLICDYFKSKINSLDSQIKELLPEEYQKIKETINTDNWFIHFVALAERADLRKSIMSQLSDYPLIRTRINDLNKIFHKTKYLKDEIDRISNRMRWHLFRLYRTRNSIIHSGDEPFFLKELCEHLHGYIDVCLNEILLLSNNFHTLESSIYHVNLNTDFLNAFIKEDRELNGKEIDKVIRYLNFEE